MKEIDEKTFAAGTVATAQPTPTAPTAAPSIPTAVPAPEAETSVLSPDIKIKSDSGTFIVNIEQFVKFGSVSKNFKVGPMTVVMRSLPSDQKDMALSLITTSPEETVVAYLRKIRYPLLAYAISKIDALEFTDAHRQALFEYLKTAQGALIDRLWAEYEKIDTEQNEFMLNEDLKKN